jgi:hypothetical protein
MLPHARTKRTTLWWIVSAALHAGLALAVAWFTPLRAMLFDRAPMDTRMPTVGQRRLDQMLGALREKYQRALARSCAHLFETFGEMNRLQTARLDDLKKRNPQLVDAAPAAIGGPQALDARPKSVARLYDYCVHAEAPIIEAYERMRGYDMAGRQYIPITQAVRSNRIARPERRRLDAAGLETRITSTQDAAFEAFKTAMVNADLEAKEICAFADRLLLLAKGIAGEDNAMGLLQWEVGNLESGIHGGMAFDEGKPYVGPVLLMSEMRSVSAGGTFTGKPVFGRKISADGEQADWMSIDSWWFIGPFVHPGRQNPEDLDKKYPPEEVVDLGAVYVGKGGRNIRWKYRQTRFVRIEPPPEDIDRYAIWYAYVEVYSDQEQDLWTAFGSDDYGKAWVEGKLVWASGKHVKPFAPGQDYRKVRFRRGYNRILVKLENAGGTTGFSVIINLDRNI